MLHDGNCVSRRSARDKVPVVRLGTPPQRESLLSAHIPDITAFLQDHRETHQDGDVNRKAGEDTVDELKVRGKHAKWCFAKKVDRHFSAADTTGRNSAISCRIYPSNTPLRLTLSILVTV